MSALNQAIHTDTGSAQQGSYLTFRTGEMHFAISAVHVRYITAQFGAERKVHRPDGKQIRVFQFENHNVSCFDFADIVGVESRAEGCAELKQLLEQRRQDHIDWLEALEQSLKNDTPFTKATDPHQCAFGKWYDSFTADDEALAHILAAFDAPHKRLHSLAERLLDMDDRDKALAILENERSITLHSLLDLFDDAQNCLNDMQRKVAVIVDVNQKLFAIELEQIDDLVYFSENQLDSSRDLCKELPIKADIISTFYHQDQSPLYLVIDPHKLVAAC